MSIRRIINIVLLNTAILLILLFLIEGMVSYISIGHTFFTQKIAERQHTEYDKELGWINLPNVYIPDMYSRKNYLTTNSQRYRSASDFSLKVPAGIIRIICSGDSFTLGFGVGDEHTWCQQLTTMDERLETVNMGQGGYGVDQAYLWYMREQAKLEHDILLFAFINNDFTRMENDTFMGYGKPYLTVKDSELFQKNYPVPRRSYDASWLAVNFHMWQELDTVKFLNRKIGRYLPWYKVSHVTKDHRHTDEVAAKIFASLQEINQANQRSVILVYLPVLSDYKENRISRWRQMVQAEAGKNGYFFVDVVEEMQKLSLLSVEKLFRKGGHYSDEGNRYVAEVIYKKLRDNSELN